MPAWGKNKDRSKMPAWLTEAEKDRVILTNRGWEIRAYGTDNHESYEVLVALDGTGATSLANEKPTFFEGFGRTSFPVLAGISGAAISPYYMEVFDLEDSVFDGDVTIAASSGWPVGDLSIATAGEFRFVITGTPENTGTGVIGITFTDGASTAFATVAWAVTLS